MHGLSDTTTRRVPARAAVALLALLALLVGGSAVHAAATKPDFGLGASPSTQTVAQGATATYTVSVTPSGGFTGPVAFAVSGLPSGATGAFAPNPLSITGTAAGATTLTVTTSSSTPTGSYPLLIQASSGRLREWTGVTLVVGAASRPDFSLSATPTSQTVDAGDSAVYAIALTRSGGFTGPVSLGASGLPRGATASFSPNPIGSSQSTSTLTIATSPTTPSGAASIVVVGQGGRLTRFAAISLTVAPAPGFQLSGSVSGLYPGASVPVDVAITNPLKQTLLVTDLSLSVKDQTGRPGCSGSENFAAEPFTGSYPISVPAGSTRTLSQLGYARSEWPEVVMHNLPRNQDACKLASLSLAYSGSATK